MTSPRKRQRARRHTYRLLNQAAAALADGERALAEKLARRALEAGIVNPAVHLEVGRLLTLLGQRAEARELVERAQVLAPGLAGLADARAELGMAAPEPAPADVPAPAPAPFCGRRLCAAAGDDEVGRLVADGGVLRLDRYVGADECHRALADLAAAGTVLSGARGEVDFAAGSGAAPAPLAEAVAELDAWAATLAAAMRAALSEPRSPPPTWTPARPGWVRLRLRDGGAWTAPAPPAGTFPFTGWLVLGPGPARLTVRDLRPGRLRERAVELAPGTAAVAVARARPVRIGGVLGLQPVAVACAAHADAVAVLHLPWADGRLLP